MRRNLRAIVSFVVGAGLLVLTASSALAVDAVVSQAFKADKTVDAGTLVSRDAETSDKVVKSDTSNRERVTGVVINKQDSFVSYNIDASSVQVATGGVVVVDVSTLNGDINSGDQLTVSPITGFAMKSTTPGKVVGHALQAFSSKTNGAQIREVKDSKGKAVQVAIGQITVSVQIGDYVSSGTSNGLIDNVQSFTSQLVGKQVAAANALIAALVLGLAVLVSGVVLYSSVSSSIHSLGRNPLSHTVVRRSLTQVILLVVALLMVSLLIAYLIIGR